MVAGFNAKTAASLHARLILLVILAAATARFFLVLILPIRFLPDEVRGDGQFMRLAANLASGDWHNEFSQYAFAKEPGYPLFLAAASLSHLPLSAAHALFQTAAILVTAWAVFRLTRSPWGAAATFVVLAFCPAGLALHRVVPAQIYWAQTLLVFSLFASVLLGPPRGRVAAAVLAGLAGLVFGWTSLTGEGGIWFVPAFAFLTLGAVRLARRSRDELRAIVRNVGVTAAGVAAVFAVFLSGNFAVYGSLPGTGAQHFTAPQWAALPRNLVAAVEAVWQPDLAAATPFCSVSVESEDFKRYWTFLNEPRVNAVQASREVTAAGWYYDSQSIEWPAFKAYDQDGQEIPLAVTRQASPDLQRYFSDERPSNNRFQLVFGSPDVCAIATLASGHPELPLVLDRKGGLYAATGSAQLYVQSISDSASRASEPGEKLAAAISTDLIGFYAGLLPFLLSIGVTAAIAAVWRAFSAQALPAMLLAALTAWILAATRIAELASVDTGASPADTIYYAAPATYAAIVAACLSLIALGAGSRLE
jgi:hypothetical protein